MSRRYRLWTGTVWTTARPVDGTYRGQVLPFAENRQAGDPIVLWECEHRHRSKQRAKDCAHRKAVEVREEYAS